MKESQKKIKPSTTKKWTNNLAAVFAIVIIFLGFILSIASLLGGFLIVISGSIFLPKFRSKAIDSGLGGPIVSQRNLKIIASLFLIVGIIMSSGGIKDKNLNEWNSNKQEILSKLEADINKNNLNDAKQVIDKFKSAIKNDQQFDGLTAKYQATKNKYEADLVAKKAEERAVAEKLAKEQALDQTQKEEQQVKNNTEKLKPNDNNIAGRTQEEINITEQTHLANMCAGFYSRYIQNATSKNCELSGDDNDLKCKAVASKNKLEKWYEYIERKFPQHMNLLNNLKNTGVTTKSYRYGVESAANIEVSQQCFNYLYKK